MPSPFILESRGLRGSSRRGLAGVEGIGEGICEREMESEPGAWGVTYLANDDIARKRPRAGFVMENNGRSWHVPNGGTRQSGRYEGMIGLTVIDL
jgi:hypothetical protein